MITNKLKEIEAAKAKIAALEKSIAADLSKELAALPGKYGFATVKAFNKAVKAAVGGKGKVSGAAKAPAAGGKKRRTRAVITDETRATLKKMVEAGKSGGAIAKALKISLPSVQNIKKALGLVKPRK
jgi:DNA-binding NarL/FixJ family response regulator